MPSRPTHLADCDRLQAEAAVECTEFSRFVVLKPLPERGKPKPPFATLPTGYKFRDTQRLAIVSSKARASLRRLAARFPIEVHQKPSQPQPSPTLTPRIVIGPSGGRPSALDSSRLRMRAVAGLGRMELAPGTRLSREHRTTALKNLHPNSVRPTLVMHDVGGEFAQPRQTIVLSKIMGPILQSIVDFAALAEESKSKAVWAVGLTFKQCWTSKGYLRGRLVRSLPLTPGEQLEVVIKTWDRRTERKSEVEAIARHLSTEVTGEEKWMLASKMTFGDQANASINPSAGANAGLTLPIDTITATLGGNLGISGSFANQLSQSTEQSTDYIHSSMLKAAQSLQTTRTNSVELTHETGEEITSRQVIANTNRCHTLTYHYFEIMERFEVHTRFHEAALHLLIPLPMPEITPEWILCHECYLRKTLPCEKLYAGLEGARRMLMWRRLVELHPPVGVAPTPEAGGKGGGGGVTYNSPFGHAVDAVLERWNVLKNAELIAIAEDLDILGIIGDFGQQVASGLEKFAEDLAKGVDEAVEQGGKLIDEGLQAVGDGLEAAGEAVGDFFGGLFGGQARMAAFASGSSSPEGGPGTWLYREVAKIAAPQIAESMTFLQEAWPQTQSLPAADRARAELNVLTTFFAKLGMPSFTFGKVDALFVGAATAAVASGGLAGGIAGGVGGGLAGAAITVWGMGISAVPGAIAGAVIGGGVGAAAGGGAVAATLALIASLEGLGFVDTVPDDEGLKDAATRLKALVDSTMSLAPVTGLPGGAVGDPAGGEGNAAVSPEEQWRQQMRELAEAMVEFDRLACHIRKHMSTYMHGLWSQWRDDQILAEVRRHGIPEDAIAPRFAGFHGSFGALPVVNMEWVTKEGGLDWPTASEDLVRTATAQTRTEEITLATPGMTVEPALGRCDACEPFIHDHRELDLENRRAEVDAQRSRALQESHEATRFKQRLDTGELTDPTPFEGASVKVDVPSP